MFVRYLYSLRFQLKFLCCFQDLKTTVLKLLKKKLRSKFTCEDEAAWNKTLDVAYSVIFKGLDKAQGSKS